MVLKLLSDHGKMYGYEIAQKVKKLSDGKILLKDGSLYPALHKLLKDGILGYEEQMIGKRVRKYYYLTSAGNKEKENQVSELQGFIQTLQTIVFSNMKGGLA